MKLLVMLVPWEGLLRVKAAVHHSEETPQTDLAVLASVLAPTLLTRAHQDQVLDQDALQRETSLFSVVAC